jgi:Sulfatase
MMSDSSTTSRRVQREILPIPDQPYSGFVAYDAKDPDSKFAPIQELLPPPGAPNVLIVLLDDVGFGASSTFGGPCQTPTAQRLAANGLRYTRFHTTALCSPTRAALLSGRNHHMVGMGGVTEIATSAPGYNSRRPNTMAPCRDSAAQRLLHRAVRQMPRSTGLGSESGGSVRSLAHRFGL